MKKVRLQYTKQGYSYIECTKEDCYSWGGLSICDDCNEKIEGKVYLVYVLGRALCEKCFNEWLTRTKMYPEDIYLQKQRHLQYYRAYGFKAVE